MVFLVSLYSLNNSSNYYGGNGATTSQAAGSVTAPTTSLLHGILTKVSCFIQTFY